MLTAGLLMNSKPLVSIGLPVYNGEPHICQALDSLLAQDYENFELIISDNASTDRTFEICEDYASKDPRIRLHANKRNIGAAANFANALALARGQYFMWAAADDKWMPGFITALTKELEEHTEAGVAMCAVERIRENGDAFDTVRYSGHADPSKMSHYQLATALTVGHPYHLYIYGLFRTDFLKRAFRNYPKVKASDRLLITQVALATKFRYVDQILHVRKIRNEPLHVRYPKDDIGKSATDENAHIKKVMAAGPYLLRSSVIPWHRKLWAPLIVVLGLINKFGLTYYCTWLIYNLSGWMLGASGRRAFAKHIRHFKE